MTTHAEHRSNDIAHHGNDTQHLWKELHQLGKLFQRAQIDSALAMAQELQPIAMAQQDELAQLNIHLVAGLCLRAQQKHSSALKTFQAGAAICERPAFIHHADEDAIHVATAIMTNLALTEFDLQHTAASNQHARRSIAWAMRSPDHQLHAINLTHAGGVLANHCEVDETTLQALEEARRDADSLDLNTYAVLAATYLMTARAEQARMKREAMQQQDTSKATLPATASPAQPSSSASDHHAERQDDTHPQTPQLGERHVVGLSSTLLGILAVLFITYILWQRRQKHRHNSMIRQLQQASRNRYLEGREEERGRLAREMHDGVSNQLLAVQMKLQTEGLTPQTLQMLSDSREQVRRLSHDLMPPTFEHTSLDESLAHYIANLNGVNGCALTYRSESAHAPQPIPAHKALGIYRIVQEAVSNILKHAQATTIAVILQQDDDAITLTIADNGICPTTKSPTNGIGLQTMQERADAIGAKIKVSTHIDAHLFTLVVPSEPLSHA